ncbi:MAG: hypothetical protein ABWX74_10900 [Aeromicrobium sp.]
MAGEEVRDRIASRVVLVPGSECRWSLSAISGRGHGRLWVGEDRMVIAHWFVLALVRGVDALEAALLLGHRCDNPLCQWIGDGHVEVSSARKSRLERVHRRYLAESLLLDPRGARARAEVLRSLARRSPWWARAEIERVRASLPEQLTLW